MSATVDLTERTGGPSADLPMWSTLDDEAGAGAAFGEFVAGVEDRAMCHRQAPAPDAAGQPFARTRALRTVADHLDPPLAADLVAGAVPITVVAYAAVGAPPIPDDAALDALRASEMPGPDELGRAATHSHDAHVVKLTDAALVEHRRTGDDLYLLAAARVLDLRP